MMMAMMTRTMMTKTSKLIDNLNWAIDITPETLNDFLDTINHSFIRMDRLARELEDEMREQQFKDIELDPQTVRILAMFLEFKETLDGLHNLFYYIKDCVDSDKGQIDTLLSRVSRIEANTKPTKAQSQTTKKTKKPVTKKKP